MKPLSLIAGLAVAAIATGPASAGIVTITYEGLVQSGYDQTGYFGVAGRVLDGAHFSARYVLSNDGAAEVYFNPPTSSEFNMLLLGGFTLTGASITIYGANRGLDCVAAGDYCSVIHHQSANEGGVWGVDTSLHSFGVDTSGPVIVTNHVLDLGLTSTIHPFTPGYDFRTPFTYAFQPGDVATGNLAIDRSVLPSDAPSFYSDYVTAQLRPTSVAVALPEPATWALMILGFGLAGATLRQRRAQPAEAV